MTAYYEVSLPQTKSPRERVRVLTFDGIENRIPEDEKSAYEFKPFPNVEEIHITQNLTTIAIANEFFSIKFPNLRKVIFSDDVQGLECVSFESCTKLEYVHLPKNSNGSTRIGFRGFARCTSLKSIVIPNTVEVIDEEAFIESGLQSITFEAGSYLGVIGEMAFLGCQDLTEIIIPANVSGIERDAFSECCKLEKVQFEESSKMHWIGDGVFHGCKKLQTINLPDIPIWFGDWVFDDCTTLKSIMLPRITMRIGESMFDRCSSLESIVLPQNLTEIPDSFCRECVSLQSIGIPSKVCCIEYNAFADCKKLSTVAMPYAGKYLYIKFGAFARCHALTSIAIGRKKDSSVYIDPEAFDKTTNVKFF